VNVSDGGVPKRQVDQAHVGYRGLDGDVQRNRRHHGRVWQAVSLWSAEIIDGLRADGHPIEPGAAGENLTVAGLDWSVLRLGTRLRIGERGPLLELTAGDAVPSPSSPLQRRRCGASRRRAIARRRVYAKVLRDGPVGVGDRVSTVPLAPPA
jgi:MOSC domain-containing protein YiiM